METSEKRIDPAKLQADTFSSDSKRVRDFLSSLSSQPVTEYHFERIRTTEKSPDSASIPRVADAGKISYDEALGISVQTMHNGLQVVRDGYYGPWMTELIKANRGVSSHRKKDPWPTQFQKF